jgi:hypothetical protein
VARSLLGVRRSEAHPRDNQTGDTTLSWVGPDERGRDLEIVALDKPDCFLVIHYRKASQ